MTQYDLEHFSFLLKAAYKAYGQNIDGETIGFMFASLQQYTLEQVNKALLNYNHDLSNMKSYAPTIKDVINLIENGDGGLQKNCELAYFQVTEAMKRVGYMTGYDFKDKVIARTVENLGGWTYLCQNVGTKKTEESFHRDFCNEWKRVNEYKEHLNGPTFVLGASDDVALTENGRLVFTTSDELLDKNKIENKVRDEKVEQEAKDLIYKTLGIIF